MGTKREFVPLHSNYCKYHIVFAPKYRRQIIYG
ncbi:MAG: IS200/IS605 family transposase, partial [Clostridia bacterium]|nr:IS200/IS605 family transposase [Clostridia bacterium]